MGLFNSIFGGSESSSQPSSVYRRQAPFLGGLWDRAYSASLGMGSGGQQLMASGQQQGGGGGLFGRYNGGRYGGGYGGGRQGTQPIPQQGGGYQQDPLSGLGASLLGQGQGITNQLAMMGQTGNPFAGAQIGQLGEGLGRLFNQQIMPGIQSTFGQSGTLGGDRQALALGQAAEGLGQSFTTGALDLLGNSSQLALQANQAALGGLGGLFNLGNASVFGSLPGLASLLGNPAILGGGSQSSGTPGILGALSGFMPGASGAGG